MTDDDLKVYRQAIDFLDSQTRTEAAKCEGAKRYSSA